jgi:hypothetical protein
VRSQFKFNIHRGGAWSGKVRRYLRAAGLDNPIFVTEAARQRHIHPRRLRNAVPVAEAKTIVTEVQGSDRARTAGATPATAANPFAQLGKKSDAPAS